MIAGFKFSKVTGMKILVSTFFMMIFTASILAQCAHPTGLTCRWDPDPCYICCDACDECEFTFYCFLTSCAVVAECDSHREVCYTWTYDGTTNTVCGYSSNVMNPLYHAFEDDFSGIVTIKVYDNDNLKCTRNYFYNCL